MATDEAKCLVFRKQKNKIKQLVVNACIPVEQETTPSSTSCRNISLFVT
jgi:hypothetical protein